MDFTQFFQTATSGRHPYPFQERFAESHEFPHLLRAPTGAGKTATAVLGWLWRWHSKKRNTPRRLVYCLPMRVLVEQSTREAEDWIAALREAGVLQEAVPVHVLMGGTELGEWHLHPEKPAILIGTQDMLLSRALNRGYAESRFHWPIDFGLLNSDCLWVFDEPQLMANGVSTSAQLAGLRHSLKPYGDSRSVWMSATLERTWLDTVDFRGKFPAAPFELTDEDYKPKFGLLKKMTADKTLVACEAAASKDGKAVAKEVFKLHQPGTQTLVIANTVDRAKAVFAELEKLRKKSESPKLLLVHSRFRPHERRPLNDQLQDKGEAAKDRIIVATQVVEAGVDISSRTLITELAPWASIVQRIGRCNRTGDDAPGRVFWIDLDEKQSLPYGDADLAFARAQLKKLDGQGVSPKQLADFKTAEGFELPFEHNHVLRRRDLLDLFDTSPDLSGNDIDISRFVRSDDPDTDVQVFWREVPKGGPPNTEPNPDRAELCSVPVGQFRDFTQKDKTPDVYIWDHLDGEWRVLDPKQLRPGIVVLLPVSAGGYSASLGWTGDNGDKIEPVPPNQSEKPEATAGDPNSVSPCALTITEHTANVCAMLEEILKDLPLQDHQDVLRKAARWHDAGKAHGAFQAGMRRMNPDLAADKLWAKSGKQGKLTYGRKHFRHELASALAVLHAQPDWDFLVAYLIATHHGKVRLSIRSLPGEVDKLPDPPPELFALGIFHNDPLPSVDLGDGTVWTENTLDLTPMRLGGDTSWTGRALKLLAEFGPFKLAYLESLLRAADVRASMKEAAHA